MNTIPDFSNYSTLELKESIETMNKEKYPENYNLLVLEYSKRESSISQISKSTFYIVKPNSFNFISHSFYIEFSKLSQNKLIEFINTLRFAQTSILSDKNVTFRYSYFYSHFAAFNYMLLISKANIKYIGDNKYLLSYSLTRPIISSVLILLFFSYTYFSNPVFNDFTVVYFGIFSSIFIYIFSFFASKKSFINKFTNFVLNRT